MIKMDDIARIAGVSKSAVSIAINGKEGISQETREKILSIISKEGYRPLRKHANKSTRILTSVNILIATDHRGMLKQNYRSLPFFDNLISSLINKFSNLGITTHIDTIEVSKLHESLNNLLKVENPEATIVLATELSEENIIFLKDKLEVSIFLDNYYPNIQADFLTTDNYYGAYSAAKFIIESGYKNIGYVASNRVNSNFKQRKYGFYDCLKNFNLKVAKKDYYEISPVVDDQSKNDMSQLVKNINNLPKVLFCENDYIAIKLIKLFKDYNLSIPDDIAIMGFDDIYAGKLINPELTTVHVAIDQIVDQGIFQLQQQIKNMNWEPQKCILSTSIVARSSI